MVQGSSGVAVRGEQWAALIPTVSGSNVVPRGTNPGGKSVINDCWMSTIIYQGRHRSIRTVRDIKEWDNVGKHSAPPDDERPCTTCGLHGGNHDIRKHRLGLDKRTAADVDAAIRRHPAGSKLPPKS